MYYNNRLQPCRISIKTSGTAPTACSDSTDVGNVLDYTYGFNLGSTNNGNVASIANNINTARSQTYTYDALNRVSTAQTVATSGTYAWGLSFGYDAWANLLTATVTQGSAYTLSVAATGNNQLSGYSYDASGNMLNDGVNTYTYNAENQIHTVAGVTYTYDGDGDRVQKSSGMLYWYGDGSDALDETDASGNLLDEYIFFGGSRIARRDPSSNVDYYFADHLGTAHVVTNASGTIQDDSDFYPYGGERSYTSSSGNTRKFTGKERDSESGLDNFGARYMSSSLGRFMSPDPLGGHQEDPQTLNRYNYVRNNPLNLTDPTGLDFWLQGGTGCGQSGVTCDKGGFVTDDKGNRVLVGDDQLRDANSGDSANFDTNGVHITTAQGTFTGQFAPGTADTRVEGAGDFAGMHAVFNSDCGGTCNANGALFGTKAQFEALLPKLLENPGLDDIDPFHSGTDQYRGGNKEGPDAHLSFKASDDPNQRDPFHFDNRYPYGSAGGFAEHTGGVITTIWNAATGKSGPPLPKDIPIASVPQNKKNQ
jgi:RHS repeat-associated protein